MENILNSNYFKAFAISPLDGRYYDNINYLSDFFSEFALIKKRIYVEIKWFQYLLGENSPIGIKIDENALKGLNIYYQNFTIEQFLKFKELETQFKHDVKPVEYLLKDVIEEKYREFVHFGLTSEDVTNLAYSLNFKEYKEKYLITNLKELVDNLKQLAINTKDFVILGHTHGQSATPTTLGKEISYFLYRINNCLINLKKLPVEAKVNGAVGNFAALNIAYPDINWIEKTENFIENLELKNSAVSKQIESHDWICRITAELSLLSSIIIDLCKDIWLYGSLNYLKQKPKEGEIGSSTMPHKVNPIDFENCWGNMEVVIALSQLFNRKLPVTFMQRDLSDSTVLRNIGLIFGHFELGLTSLKKGLSRIVINREYAEKELENHPEVLSEAIQTVLRKNKIKNSYEILKDFTRGKEISNDILHRLIESINISSEDKEILLNLKTRDYIGESKEIVDKILKIID